MQIHMKSVNFAVYTKTTELFFNYCFSFKCYIIENNSKFSNRRTRNK